MIEFDVETTGLQWYWDQVFLAQFLDTALPGVAPKDAVAFRHPQDRARIQDWLNGRDGYRAWNAKFDLHFLDAMGYTLPPEHQWHDGMLLAHILDERKSAALKRRGELLFGEGAAFDEKQVKEWLATETRRRRKESKAEGSEFTRPNYSHVPDEIMLPYALEDVRLQRRVCEVLERNIATNDELRDVYELERGVLAALFNVERRGMPIDVEAARALDANLETELDRLMERAVKLAGIKTFNPGSPQQIGEALKRRGADMRFAGKTPTGNLKTDEESLSAIDDPLAATILEFRGTQKMYAMVRRILHGDPGADMFGKPFLGPDDRLHPFYRQVGARTGRMSCAEPNVQQWHRDDLRMRHLVQARPGYKIITADLSSVEMAVFAAYAGDGALLDAIKNGDDVHTLTANRAGLKERKRSTGAVESVRQRGKILNFTIIYGGGVRTLRKSFGVNQAGARDILNRYYKAFPEVKALQNKIEFALEDNGYVKSAWGRRFRVERNASQEAYKFTNYLVQGTAADLLKAAAVECHKQGVPLIGCVHDELIAEVPEEDSEEAARIIVKAMTDHPRLTRKVPLSADADIVDRWSDAKEPGYAPPYMKEK